MKDFITGKPQKTYEEEYADHASGSERTWDAVNAYFQSSRTTGDGQVLKALLDEIYEQAQIEVHQKRPEEDALGEDDVKSYL